MRREKGDERMEFLFGTVLIGSYLAAWAFGAGSLIGKVVFFVFIVVGLPLVKSWPLRALSLLLIAAFGALIATLFGWTPTAVP